MQWMSKKKCIVENSQNKESIVLLSPHITTQAFDGKYLFENEFVSLFFKLLELLIKIKITDLVLQQISLWFIYLVIQKKNCINSFLRNK
jgi:hypothetical protein